MSQVVEFLEEQRFVCAVCLGQKATRYHLLTHLGREMNLARGRLLHVSQQRITVPGREARIRELQAIDARRNALRRKPEIPELWELVQEEQEISTPRSLAELAFSGEVTPDHEAAMIRAVIDDHTYFKFREGLIAAQSPETVHGVLEQRAREQERLQRLERGAAWIKAMWSNDSEERLAHVLPDADEDFWITALKDYCLHDENAREASLVRQLFRNAHLKNPLAAFYTLVKAGIWSEDQNLDLLRHEIALDFSTPVLTQAEELAARPVRPNEDGREDLTACPIFTIDAPESLDLDDALSIRPLDPGWEVGIHITDIGLNVLSGTPLFEEALRRATTIYLPDEKIPMIPNVLSQEAWSLEAGSDRRALSFLVRLDSTGRILGQRLVRSVIRVQERLTYEEADARLEEGGPLHRLHELCFALQTRRIEAGALPLPIPELNIQVGTGGEVHVTLVEPGPARFLVSECMILANMVAASFLRDKEIPGLFRSQPEPRERIIDGEERDLLANFRQRRLISRGHLGPEPAFHHGLGLETYTTVTSPLRRALDLLMQQQITSMLSSGRPVHDGDGLSRYVMVLQAGLEVTASIRQARTRYWLLKYLEAREGSLLPAHILEAGPRRIQAVLRDYLMLVELPRHPGRNYSLGQEVEIRLQKVNARENILKVDWAAAQSHSTQVV